MPSTSSDSGLSTGAQAGIGVGVAAACVGLAAAGVILWRRRRKQHATVPEPGAASYPELSGEDSRLEKDGKGSAGEMVTEANVHEMQQPPAELSATPEEHGRLTDHRL